MVDTRSWWIFFFFLTWRSMPLLLTLMILANHILNAWSEQKVAILTNKQYETIYFLISHNSKESQSHWCWKKILCGFCNFQLANKFQTRFHIRSHLFLTCVYFFFFSTLPPQTQNTTTSTHKYIFCFVLFICILLAFI